MERNLFAQRFGNGKKIVFGVLAAFVAALSIWSSGYSPFGVRPIGTVSHDEEKPEIDSYVRNESWETGFLSSVPYRKGDVLEFAFFAEFSKPYTYGFDWNSILAKFDLVTLVSEDAAIDPSSLNGKAFRNGSKIVMRLRAKSSGSTNSDAFFDPSIKASSAALPSSSTWSLSETGTTASTGVLDISALALPEKRFFSDTNNALRIVWAPKGSIRGVVIGSNSFKGADFPNGYVFVVDRWLFADGDYFVAAYSKEGKLVPIKDKITFVTDQQSVGVSYVTPSSVPSTRDSFVTLQGKGFSKVVSVQLSNSLVIKNASIRAVDDTVAIVRIPAGIPVGEYAMNVMDVKGISSPKRAVVRITK